MFRRILVAVGAIAVLALRPVSTPARQAAPDEGFDLQAAVVVHAFQAVVEQEFRSILNGLSVLASTDDVQSADWLNIKEPLTHFSHTVPNAAAVFFVHPDGSYFTVAEGLTPENLSDRAYFPSLMAGKNVEGQLVISKSTGKKSVIVATPIAKDGRVIGALGVSVSVEKLAAEIDQLLRLPQNVVFYALDHTGETALHRDSALIFEFPSSMGSETLSEAVQTMLTHPSGVVRYTFRGQEKVAVFDKSAATGWVFVLGQTGAVAAPH